ncbi:MAG: L-ribulose-5-phosphate 3-epimerase, partial [Rectinema sp.]|nr:L-ribulose-5-phosphate 3-epimerase [Rectinema sp.]
DVYKRQIQLAGYDVYYEPSTPDTRARFRDAMLWTAELASRAQVMVAMEIMDYPLMNSITRWLPYAERAASPWFCVYPDVGNLSAWWNDVPAELKANIHRIVAVHLKDTLPVGPDFPGRFREVPFGMGCVDFVEVFRALAEVHYKGAFLIEMWNGATADAFEEIVRARSWMLERMKEGGLIGND